MDIKKVILTLILLFIPGLLVSKKYYLREMAYVTVGGVYAANSYNFFEDYKNIIGGRDELFNHTPSLGAGLKFWLGTHYRLSANVEYFNSELSDNFVVEDSLSIGTVTRNVTGEMNISTTPIILSIDYIPVEQQFKTYVSFGAGIVISNFYWKEEINSSRPNDQRESGVKYDETEIFPVFRTAFGVELDFDESVIGTVIGNLTFELRYTYILREMEVFKNIKAEFTSYPTRWDETYSMMPGYLGLNLQFGIEYFHTIGKD